MRPLLLTLFLKTDFNTDAGTELTRSQREDGLVSILNFLCCLDNVLIYLSNRQDLSKFHDTIGYSFE